MRTLPTSRIFCRAEARSLGWSDAALSRAVGRGDVLRLRRDRFTVLRADPQLDAAAAVMSCVGSVISHRSAALVHGLPLVGVQPQLPELTVQPYGTGDVRRAHLYRASLRDHDVCLVSGEPVTSVARTIVDIGRHRTCAAAVAAADYALHERLTTLEELHDVLDFCRAWPGHHRAERALALLDPRAESPLESISRLVFRWLRLPPPRTQQRIGDEHGRFVARLDFYWDRYGVAGEADGRSKFERDENVLTTWDRHTGLDDLGLQIARWGWTEPTRNPHALEERIRRAFERGSRRDALGLSRRWTLLSD